MTSVVRCAFVAVVTALVVACIAAPTPAVTPFANNALGNSTQLVVVTTPGWDSTAGVLRRFTRADVHSSWHADGVAVPIVVGRTGIAWGVGFDHLAGAGTPTAGPRKVEGDGRAPAGVFPLDTAFGFAAPDSMSWVKLPYIQLTPSTECVDDTASVHYNAVVDRSATATIDWKSSEHMRKVSQYQLGIIVGYNASPPVKGRGSCIFFHIWAGARSATVGCTALDVKKLEKLVAWLDPRARPVVVQLPAPVYARVRREWGLPD